MLYFVSDRSGWWNLHRINSDGTVETVCEMQAEFGMPQWGFGMSTYAFESAERIVCTYIENGISRLALIDTRTKTFEPIACSYTDIRFVRASPGQAVMRAGSPTEAASIVKLDLETRCFSVLRRSNNLEIDARYLSNPRAIEFPTEDGTDRSRVFLSAKEWRLPRTRGRTSAAVGCQPRRSNIGRDNGVESRPFSIGRAAA